MNALVPQESRFIASAHSFDEMERMAQVVAQSGLFGVKNPVQALALMLVAQAEGEHPASVAQDYDVIQGKGTRKTHSVLARFQAMGGKVDWHELSHTRAEATFSHAKGGSLRLDWTIEQAKQAGLTGKDNWKGYARAMLRARLIAEGVRAVYPAAIGGWQVPEEAMGPQLDAGNDSGSTLPPPAASRAQPETYPQIDFDKNLPTWTKAIQTGKKTADDLIAMVETKAKLTDEQKAAINAIQPPTDATPKAEQPSGDGPMFTYAQLVDQIQAAIGPSELDTVRDLARGLPDDQRTEIDEAIYQRAKAIGLTS